MKQGQFPAVVSLSGINKQTGIKLSGLSPGDSSGYSISGIGDINHDGIDDFAIGVPQNGPSPTGSGIVYVIFGNSGINQEMISLDQLNGRNGFQIWGESLNDQLGRTLSMAGDMNGDQMDDLLIGAIGAGRSGCCYVLFGSPTIGDTGFFNLTFLDGQQGFKINGEREEQILTGVSVSGGSDINSDGYTDILIGSWYSANGRYQSGRSYLVFGGQGVGRGGVLNLTDLNGSNGFKLNGEARGDISGSAVSMMGDINGDGIDDLMIGAENALSQAGRSYVLWGNKDLNRIGAEFNLSDLNGVNGFKLEGENQGDRSGISVSGIGDINQDGYSDLIIGAPFASSSNGYQSGVSYVVFGGNQIGYDGLISLSDLNGRNGFKIIGKMAGEISGAKVSGAEDFNRDGVDDFFISSPVAGVIQPPSSYTYLLFGSTQLGNSGLFSLSSLNGSNGLMFTGESPGDNSGFSLSAAGDINQDGIADILIGAPQMHGGGKIGRSYLIFGDSAPILIKNALNIAQNETVVLTGDDIQAEEKDSTSTKEIWFHVSQIQHGRFTATSNIDIVFTRFSQSQVNNGTIQFIHDGSIMAPSYQVCADHGGLAFSSPETAVIAFKIRSNQISGLNDTIRNAIIGSVVSGAFSLLCLGLRWWISRKLEHSFSAAILSESRVERQQTDFHNEILRPIAKRILQRIKIGGFMGYISDHTMHDALSAINALMIELENQGVSIDLTQLNPTEQRRLLDVIVRQTRRVLVPEINCCSITRLTGFFRPEILPNQIEEKAAEIAAAVKASLGENFSEAKTVTLSEQLLSSSSPTLLATSSRVASSSVSGDLELSVNRIQLSLE